MQYTHYIDKINTSSTLINISKFNVEIGNTIVKHSTKHERRNRVSIDHPLQVFSELSQPSALFRFRGG